MLASVLLSVFALQVSTGLCADRGLGWPWNTPNGWASNLVNQGQIRWYYHWDNGPIGEMGGAEYVPMFWGQSNMNAWNARKQEMNANPPRNLLAFNEPDNGGPNAMDPAGAADLYVREIMPWAGRGVRLGSPGMAFNLDWLGSFINEVGRRGGHVDFVALHWYGSWDALGSFQAYVQDAHNRFGRNIWITELGITASSNPNQAQVKSFMMNAIAWLNSQPYVERVAWFGCWAQAPDGFVSPLNALYRGDGGLSDMGFWYGRTLNPDRRDTLAVDRRRSRLQIAA